MSKKEKEDLQNKIDRKRYLLVWFRLCRKAKQDNTLEYEAIQEWFQKDMWELLKEWERGS